MKELEKRLKMIKNSLNVQKIKEFEQKDGFSPFRAKIMPLLVVGYSDSRII